MPPLVDLAVNGSWWCKEVATGVLINLAYFPASREHVAVSLGLPDMALSQDVFAAIADL